jgi:hypothetical protein
VNPALGAVGSQRPRRFSGLGSQVTLESQESELAPTIFHKAWWLEIASGGRYQEVTVSSGGRIVGRLPYLVSNTRLRLKVLSIPQTTHVLGPAILQNSATGNYPNALKQISITRDLIEQLPKVSHISFRCHRGVSNTLAFNAAGFSTSADYTVVVPPAPKDVQWRQMRDKTRNVIRRAQEHLTVADFSDAEMFMDFYEANLRERGLHSHYDRRICVAIMQQCFLRKAGRILKACDSSGNMQSAIFTIWDNKTEYYFMSTRSAKSASGATSLCIWSALQHAGQEGLIFDFDGLHVRDGKIPNLLLFTGFGGTIVPLYVVRRTSPAVQLVRFTEQLVRYSPR